MFSFREEDDAALKARLGQELNLSGVRADAPPRIEWWPILLRGSLDGERLAATGLKGYPVSGQPTARLLLVTTVIPSLHDRLDVI